MRSTKFPDNCRTRVIHSFGGHGAGGGHSRLEAMSDEDFKTKMGVYLREAFLYGSQCMCVATLNSHQVHRYEPFMFEFGWKKVRKYGSINLYVITRDEYRAKLNAGQ